MRRSVIVALLGVLLVSTASVAHAQGRQRHDGFWIGFGLGAGALTSGNLDESERGGAAGYVRLGGTLSQKILMGGELSFWGRQEDTFLGENTVTLTRANATFTVIIYPSDNGGFFMKGGFGGANIQTQVGNLTQDIQGLGTTIGLGFDVRLGRNLYLTPNADLLLQTFEQDNDETVTNGIILLTIGLTWH